MKCNPETNVSAVGSHKFESGRKRRTMTRLVYVKALKIEFCSVSEKRANQWQKQRMGICRPCYKKAEWVEPPLEEEEGKAPWHVWAYVDCAARSAFNDCGRSGGALAHFDCAAKREGFFGSFSSSSKSAADRCESH